MKLPRKAGLIGLGAIGSAIVKETTTGGLKGMIEVVSIMEKRDIDSRISLTGDFAHFLEDIEKKGVTIVIEAASQQVVKDHALPIVKKGIDMLIMSTGAFLTYPELLLKLKDEAVANDSRIYLPSGAIAGIDALSALAKCPGKLNVTLETRKPPKSLAGVPYLEQKNIDVFALKEPEVIFEGTAGEACKIFPKNINVSATIVLSGVDPKNLTVKIICDPRALRNSHEITAHHESAGKMTSGSRIRTEQFLQM
ncbi:MAG: aspartate dehydrogenase domain-containing protein [Candidatus Hodarchaeales archaeon]